MTHAPLVADGVLITGISGGEYGTRGFLDGWDLKTGEKMWHRWTTAAPGEKGGDTWNPGTAEKGGAPTWLTGTYDPDLNLVYWGTGNGGPWNAGAARQGLRCTSARSWRSTRPPARSSGTTSSRPATRTTTTRTNELVLAEMPVDGTPRKVLMQANRNGFFYVLDRTNGKLLSANAVRRRSTGPQAST